MHAAPTAAAHVFVAALQTPAAHTTSAPCTHTPVRTPSLGIGAPGASFARHVRFACSQYCEAPQSLSTKQPEPPAGTQRPLGEQAFEAHWAATTQAALSGDAQVFSVALQIPVTHAEFVPTLLQVLWRPSAGSTMPPASLSVHVNVLRAQKRPDWQSESA